MRLRSVLLLLLLGEWRQSKCCCLRVLGSGVAVVAFLLWCCCCHHRKRRVVCWGRRARGYRGQSRIGPQQGRAMRCRWLRTRGPERLQRVVVDVVVGTLATVIVLPSTSVLANSAMAASAPSAVAIVMNANPAESCVRGSVTILQLSTCADRETGGSVLESPPDHPRSYFHVDYRQKHERGIRGRDSRETAWK